MNSYLYIIAEFNDGLQLIPALWYNAERNSSIWPTHFKSKFRINKAIMTREMPQKTLEWEELPVKRIFGRANTYEEGMEKLVLAEDTSNIDDIMSSDELREQKKQRRRIKAKKYMSSSSEEDVCFNKNENTCVRKNPATLLFSYPEIGDFVSSNKKMHIQRSIQNDLPNALCQRSISYEVNRSDRTTNSESFPRNTQDSTKKSNEDSDTENSFTREYKKLVLGKLNKVLYKLNSIENRMNILEDKMQHSNYSGQEEVLIQLPITTFEELAIFEEQLKEVNFKEEAINTFKLIGGNTARLMVRNILKKAVTNSFAQHFSWAGKKTKRTFQDLGLTRLIIQAVRIVYKHISDAEIADIISKWLAQAPVRIERAKHLTKETGGNRETGNEHFEKKKKQQDL